MDKGRVVQEGSFHELVNQPGLMQELWRLQQGRAAYRPEGKDA
jgi:ATP-binding cassette subfamily B protein